MIEKLVDLQIKYSKILFIILVIIVGLAAYTAKDLKIDPSFSALVSEESEFNTNDRLIRNTFEVNDGIIILIRRDDNSKLEGGVYDLNEIINEYRYLDDLKTSLQESPYVRFISEPELSDDSRNIKMNLALASPDRVGGFQESLSEINSIISEVGAPPGIKAEITGLPVLLNRVSTLLITDSLTTILITFAFIFLVLLWYSKDFYFTLITITTPAVSLVLLASLMVLFGINVTITLAAVGVLVLGLGADYSIHIATHYRAARREHEDHIHALKKTINELFVPITASFITTLAGFTALIFGVSPSSQAQGLVLNLGIVVIYLTSFLLFPVLLTIFAEKINIKSNQTFRKIISLLTKLAIFQANKSKVVISIIVVLTLIMMFGASKVQFSTSNSNWIPEGDPVAESFRELNYVYGSDDTLTLILTSNKGDLRDVQTVKDIEIMKSKLLLYPNVDYVRTPYDNLNEKSRSGIYEYVSSNQQIREQFNEDYTLTRIVIGSQNFQTSESGSSPILSYVGDVVKETPVHNTDISLYGDIIRFEELGDSLERDAGVTTLLGLGLVFFVASAIYASISVGFIALVPIIIAVIWAVGLMGFFGVPFTSLSTGIISLVLGVGVDFSIHIVDSIKKFMRRGKEIEEAISKTLETSGAAVLLSSVTTFIGFSALTFATLLGTQRLGWSLAFSIIAVFFVTITIVPAIVSLTQSKKNV